MALRSVSTIVCSDDFTVCINNEQNVVSFGRSDYGAHGHEEINVFPPKIISSLNHIISISVGDNHCVCLDNDGNVYTFGNNNDGQLGIGIDKDLEYTSIPQKVNLPPCAQISCGLSNNVCLSESREVYSFGAFASSICYYPELIYPWKDVEFIECGGFHVFYKTLNNEIYCWGFNDYGQLGLENNTKQDAPILCSSLSNEDIVDIKCGDYFTLVLTLNGDVLSCGYNEEGQLGRETSDKYSSSFAKIEDLPEITRIECGLYHSLCIDVYNDLYVFGENRFGQLGLGDTNNRYKPIKHPSLSNIIDVSKGGCHTFVKISNNEIYAFGNNEYSQLGIKTEHEDQLTPIRVFEDNEDIWYSNINKSKAKSARSIL